MAKKSGIKDDRKKWDKLKKNVTKMSKGDNAVDIGLFGEQGSELVLYASTNEFGSDDGLTPERSFLRSTFEEEKKAVKRFLDKNKVKVALGKVSKKKLLNKVGFKIVGAVQIKISSGEFTPNAPSVVRRKTIQGKEGTPLIDTGRMRQSITHKVRD